MNTKKTIRLDRIKEQIKKNIAQAINTKIKDPRMEFITITDVELTADYSIATIHYTILQEDKKQIIQKALEHAKGYLRKELSSKLKIFKTPELKFKYDMSISRGITLTNLIDKVTKHK